MTRTSNSGQECVEVSSAATLTASPLEARPGMFEFGDAEEYN